METRKLPGSVHAATRCYLVAEEEVKLSQQNCSCRGSCDAAFRV